MLMILTPLTSLIKPSYNITILTWSLTLFIAIIALTPTNTHIINSWLMMDTLSFAMIILSLITLLLISVSSNQFNKMIHTIVPITLILMLTFTTNNMIMFYISFELVLIPTFILITSLGKQPERLQASIYLLLYTVLASLPLLASIIMISPNSNFLLPLTLNHQYPLALIFIMAFLVKLPMFSTHLWLPKAHVEAPLEGSMILAAILLKLGGYGLLRFSSILSKSLNQISPWLISLSLIGAFFTSMNCLRQKDMKALIAYSSVAHMALVIISILTLKSSSPNSATAMMLAHGLTSSALFFLVNLLYLQHHSRNILSFKGLLNTNPNLTFWLFVFICLNLSAPPSLNFLSEITIIMMATTWNPSTMIPLFLATLSTASFCFIMYVMLSHSSNTLFNHSPTPSQKTFLSLLSHFSPLLLILMKPEIFMI